MPVDWFACISAVPAFALPKISNSVGRRVSPACTAPAAWSMRANTVPPLAVTAAARRSIVTLTLCLLTMTVRPGVSMPCAPGSERF